MQQLQTVKYRCVYTVATLQQLLLDHNTLDELPNLYSSASHARDSPHLGTLPVAERKTHMKEVLGQPDYQFQTACR